MHSQYHKFDGQPSKAMEYLRSLPLEAWRALAPAVLDNMYIRRWAREGRLIGLDLFIEYNLIDLSRLIELDRLIGTWRQH
jgi:hypothetical protein